MRRPLRPWRGRAVAAGLLVVLLGAALWVAVRAVTRPRAAGRFIRPITADAVAPGGALILAWEGGGPPFRVILTAPDGVTLWRSEKLPTPLARVPDQVRDRMARGTEHRWRVEAVDGIGRPFRSEPFRIVLRPEPDPDEGVP